MLHKVSTYNTGVRSFWCGIISSILHALKDVFKRNITKLNFNDFTFLITPMDYDRLTAM